jgi:phosphatidylserine/phosphatidylglycerophosphate/cardiolipin synthase-like enzyme
MEFLIGEQFPDKVIPLINEAKKSIQIIVFEWIWYPNNNTKSIQLFNQSIVRARNRGVNIEVVANSMPIVKVLNELNIKARKLSTRKLIHSKVMIIDEKDVVIGSHNYTQNAFTSNFEVSVYIKEAENIKTLLTHFNYLYNLSA